MLVLQLDKQDKLQIGDNVEMFFKWKSDENTMRVYIDAPREIPVKRVEPARAQSGSC